MIFYLRVRNVRLKVPTRGFLLDVKKITFSVEIF